MVNHKLLIGTNDGFYGTLLDENGSPTRLLKSARVLRLRQLGDEIYAATRSGLFRSEDSGGSWAELHVPRPEVYSVVKNTKGDRLYAGTHPAHLYLSKDNGGACPAIAMKRTSAVSVFMLMHLIDLLRELRWAEFTPVKIMDKRGLSGAMGCRMTFTMYLC